MTSVSTRERQAPLRPRRRQAAARRPWPALAVAVAVAALGAGACGLAGGGETRATQAPPANVVLVVCDTLRADFLGLYGHPRPTSPFLDSLASRALVYEQAYSHYSYTWPTISNLFTGIPYSALVRDGLFTSPKGATASGGFSRRNRTLAQQLQAWGVGTAAVSANPYVTGRLGFDKGFAAFHDVYSWNEHFWESPPHKYTAGEVNAAALPLVDRLQAAGGPWLLYLHYFDSHMPYQAPAADRKPFVDPTYDRRGRVDGYLTRPDGSAFNYLTGELENWIEPADVAFLRAQYEAEIHHLDGGLRDLFAALEARGALANTTVIVTADHGEAFLERGFWGHGFLSRAEEERVPLIVVPPPASATPPRRERRAVATTTDLYYSLLRHFGPPGAARPSPWWAVDVLTGERLRPVTYTEGGHGATILRNARFGLYRYERLRQDGVPLPVEDGEYLFDRASDPGERVDLLAGGGEAAREVRKALLARSGKELQQRLPGGWSDPLLTAGGEMEQQLRALGYQ